MQWTMGDLSVPSMFACQECDGEMYPEYYKGIHGVEYKPSCEEVTDGEKGVGQRVYVLPLTSCSYNLV